MTLTKKHFKAIAEIINKNIAYEDTSEKAKDYIYSEIINELSEYFKTENPLFDEDKFKGACLK